MTRTIKVTRSENVTLRKQVREQQELLSSRKAREKDNQVASKGRFVFSTQEVLEIAGEAKRIHQRRISADGHANVQSRT